MPCPAKDVIFAAVDAVRYEKNQSTAGELDPWDVYVMMLVCWCHLRDTSELQVSPEDTDNE